MLERFEKEKTFGTLHSSEVFIHDGENRGIRIMTVLQANTDEVQIEITEEIEFKPRSMRKI